jgi:hypothetical protein
MKKYIRTAVMALWGFTFVTCDSYNFDAEQYKNEISLLSDNEGIYNKQVAKMQNNGDIIYLVATLSGSNAPKSPFNVTLQKSLTVRNGSGAWAEDETGEYEFVSLFDLYNKSNFDIDTTRFARLLPEECFTIPSLSGQISAGAFQHRFPVHLRNLDQLSPDTAYFLNYRIDPSKTDVFNPNRQEVLLRIYVENEFASTRTSTFYTYISSTITNMGNGNVARPTSSVQTFPLSENAVRMLAGNEAMGDYTTALERINANSITLTMGAQTAGNPLARHVTITPYKDIDVVQLPPFEQFDNTFVLHSISTPDGRITHFKEFRLHYQYRLQPTDAYREVKATLRLEYNPRADQL